MADPQRAKTILFVDDDGDFVLAISPVLRSAGYRVVCAADGEEGVRLAAREKPDLILLDFMMPVKSGFDASREIRDTPGLEDVPIIALTAFSRHIGELYGLDQENRRQVRLRECIEKPVEPNVLLERVASALEGA